MNIGSDAWRDLIREGGAALGVTVDGSAMDRICRHADELLAWNRRVNLTAITDPHEVAVKHYIDAMAPAPHIPQGARLLDMGAGGGFPGLALKIVRPDIQALLIDAARKKASFLSHAIRLLGLSGAAARHIRAEALAEEIRGGGRGWDVVICRAFSDLALFFKLARPLTAPGGMMLAMKGDATEAEIAAARSPWGHERVIRYRLPFTGARRTLVIQSVSNSAGE